MIDLEIVTNGAKTKVASCVCSKYESVKILQVRGWTSGNIAIKSSAGGDFFDAVKGADDNDLVISSNGQWQLPVGNYVIKAEFDGAAATDGLVVSLS
ncbi:MAG: hypothetical protein LBV16_03185 [Elusimicrobiota bacterium]|jgi:hypothetical protein|nr:hypothetical protein [Elusimicrobiota bacterium]